MNTRPISYNDCVNADGSFNRAAIMHIACCRARHQRNIAVVVDREGAPTQLSRGRLSSARDDYAARAAEIGHHTVEPWSVFLGRELREVWDWAHIMRERFLREPRRAA